MTARLHLRCYLVEASLPLAVSPNLQLWVHRNDALGMVDLPTLAESAEDAHDIERDALWCLA